MDLDFRPIKCLLAIGILAMFTSQIPSTYAIKWLALSKSKFTWNSTSHCSRARRLAELVSAQAKLCKRHVEIMPHITAAAVQTVHVCQLTFADRRWNCSSIETAPKLTPDLTTGTREQAFALALSSAAIVHTISRVCSSGLIFYCGCAPTPQEPPHGDFKWGGCGDNIRYGVRISKLFADAPWQGKKRRETMAATINRRNNQAGRQALEDSLQTQCKCHGVSGSCSVRTCWRALPKLAEIAGRLKRRYAVATEVVNKRLATRQHLQPTSVHRGRFREDDLVYVTKSPDYCIRDPRFGSLGTRGRTCNATSEGDGGCDSMCCGRGFRTYTVEKKERCHCKYYWCCYVKCKVCVSTVQVHECY